jgi:beta-glucosidase
MKPSVLFTICIMLNVQSHIHGQVYKNPNAPLKDRVDDLLSRMTIDEKIGQMLQAERSAVTDNNNITIYFLGSVLSGGGSAPANNSPEGWADMYDLLQQKALSTRLGIPVIYGTDAVHGNNNLLGSVIFPHNIGMGCTRDPDLVKSAAHITAIEVAATGVDWTFSPCLAVPQDEHWGRTYEGYGETADLVKMMATAAIEGYQGDTLSDSLSILACAKHFMGDGGTTNGVDQGNTQIDETTLRTIHLPGYIEAVKSNVATVMASFSSWNGQKMHGNKYLLTDVLKTELGFNGFIVSDWNGLHQLPGTFEDQIRDAVNAGIDMLMEPNAYTIVFNNLKHLVEIGEVTQERIDDAVRRILTVKFEMGLFEHPYSNRFLIDSVGNEYHQSVARQCVRESLVLLKKRDDLLPLAKQSLKIHVAGSNANNLGNQCGGWTVTWQGSSGNITNGTTIYQGLQQVAPGNDFFYTADASDWENEDIGIVVIGETPYAEGYGDIYSIDNILSQQDIDAVKRMKSYNIPVIVILVTGRPINISEIYPYADAIIAAWLPGTEGQGIADVIFGDYSPMGRLGHTWPKNNSQVPVNFGDAGYSPLYSYNYGITSLNNSPKKTSPELYAAFVGANGKYIELSFNKKISDPSHEMENFQVLVGNESNTINSLDFAGPDSFRIRIGVESIILINQIVNLTYMPGSLMSADSGMVSEIIDYKVKNDSKITDTNLNEFKDMEEISIYPNPAKDGCYIHISDTGNDEYELVLYRTSGQKIKQSVFSGSGITDFFFNMNDLLSGIYIMQVSNLHYVKTFKLIIANSN